MVFLEDELDCSGVVFNVELVVDLLFVVVNWEWFFFESVEDDEGNEFFWEVEGVVVV